MTNPDISEAPKITFEQAKSVLEVSGIPVFKADYVALSDIVPAAWDWFWEMLDCNEAPFSFGDNNFSMVTGDRFAEWLEECYEYWVQTEVTDVDRISKEDWDKFIGSIWMCNDAGIFIDLET
jgi:protein tyrosine phosphatase